MSLGIKLSWTSGGDRCWNLVPSIWCPLIRFQLTLSGSRDTFERVLWGSGDGFHSPSYNWTPVSAPYHHGRGLLPVIAWRIMSHVNFSSTTKRARYIETSRNRSQCLQYCLLVYLLKGNELQYCKEFDRSDALAPITVHALMPLEATVVLVLLHFGCTHSGWNMHRKCHHPFLSMKGQRKYCGSFSIIFTFYSQSSMNRATNNAYMIRQWHVHIDSKREVAYSRGTYSYS